MTAVLYVCAVSCNPKTEKVVEKIYDDVKKAKPGAHVHFVKEPCQKCSGWGKHIVGIDYYGNYITVPCDECDGKGYVYKLKSRY